MSDIFTGQILPFEFTVSDQDGVIVNLASATLLEIIFKRPDKTTFKRTAALVGDGTDGKITYTTVISDLDAAGSWNNQAEVTVGGVLYPSTISEFTVFTSLSS